MKSDEEKTCGCGCHHDENGNCINTYTITFDSTGGFPPIQEIQVDYGQVVEEPVNPQRVGYQFVKWFRKFPDETLDIFSGSRRWDLKGDATYIAEWKPEGCVIKWDTQCASVIPSRNVNYGQVLGELPPRPDNDEKYEFLGWFTHKNGGKRINELTHVSGDATYHAIWKIGTRTVKFFDNGNLVEERHVQYGGKIGKLPEDPYRTGYKFLGWGRVGTSTPIDETFQVTQDISVETWWQPNPYTIEWNTGGHGTLHPDTMDGYNIETASQVVFHDMSETGWTFLGWYDEHGVKITEMENGTTGNRKFTARWKINEWTIKLQESADIVYEYTIEYGQAIYEVVEQFPQPQKYGHTFSGWWTQATGGEQVFETETYLFDCDWTYYPHWEAIDYTITFDADGGEPESQKIEIPYDQYISRYVSGLEDPVRTGYGFDGWDGINQTVVASTTVYAKWQPNVYYVKYNGNGNSNTSVTMPRSEHRYDEFKSLSPNQYQRTYTVTYKNTSGTTFSRTSDSVESEFLGWSTYPNGKKEYSDKQSVVNLREAYGSEIELYAKWETGKITLPEISKDGHTFRGWFNAETGGTKIGDAGFTFELRENLYLYPQWIVNKYTIVLDSRGGTPAVQTLSATYDQAYPSFPQPVYAGWDFKGWMDKNGADFIPSGKYTATENSSYYAKWEKQSINVTFKKHINGDTGDGAANLLKTVTKKMDEPFSISSDGPTDPTQANWNFLGWSQSPSATEPEYGGISGQNIVAFNRNVTLYGVWEYNVCKVYFVSVIGSISGQFTSPSGGQENGQLFLTVTKGQSLGDRLPTCQKGDDDDDMEFLGWFTESIGGSRVTGSTPIIDSKTLFSQWTSRDALDAYQSRAQNLDEYLKELLGKEPETEEGEKISPAEERRLAIADLFQGDDQLAYRTSSEGMTKTSDIWIKVYFYTDGSSESALRHEVIDHGKTKQVSCDYYSWEYHASRWKLPKESCRDGKDNYFYKVPVFPMLDMKNYPAWNNYQWPGGDLNENVDENGWGCAAPLWSKRGETSPGWVVMDMTKNNGWGKAMETGATIPHDNTKNGVTFSSKVTYFNNIYQVGGAASDKRLRWVWLNEKMKWNGCYSFWGDFSPKKNGGIAPETAASPSPKCVW